MTRLRTHAARAVALVLLAAVLGAAAAACTVGGSRVSADLHGLGGSLSEIQKKARKEGKLTLVTWPGYADTTWTEPFERQTGCVVDAHEVSTPDAMLNALENVDWDGVSASGRVAGRLVDEDRVAPLDPKRVPNYGQLVAGVRAGVDTTDEGEPYGMPFGRVPNLLLFRTDAFPEDMESWAALWEEGRSLGSTVFLPDDPLVIADAALYLAATRPELGIRDPYELDPRQLQIAARLVRRLRPTFTSPTLDAEARAQAFLDGGGLVGRGTPAEAEYLQSLGAPVSAVKPAEGTTGRSDLWMISRGTDDPNCLYLWLDYVGSPSVQAAAAETLHQAPVNPAACELTESPDLCAELHALDDVWWEDVDFEKAPLADCGDHRGDACTTEEDWAAAWAALRQRR